MDRNAQMMKNLALFMLFTVLISSFLLGMPKSAFGHECEDCTEIHTDKDVYALGDLVAIELHGRGNYGLRIHDPAKVLRYSEQLSEHIEFTPDECGMHNLVLFDVETLEAEVEHGFLVDCNISPNASNVTNISINTTQNLTQNITIPETNVTNASIANTSITNTSSGNLSINYTNNISDIIPKHYFLIGESVEINLESFEFERTELYIRYTDQTFKLVKSDNDPSVFIPYEFGKYTIEVFMDNKLFGNLEFLVASNETNLSDYDRIPYSALLILDSQFNFQEVDVHILLPPTELDIFGSGTMGSVQINGSNKSQTDDSDNLQLISSLEGNRVMVEAVFFTMPFQRIVFDDLLLQPGTLRVQELSLFQQHKSLEDANIVKAFAIDPSNLDFTSGKVHLVAQGRELFKCKEWNFEQSICEGVWEKQYNLVPGQKYSISLTPDDPGFVEVGGRGCRGNDNVPAGDFSGLCDGTYPGVCAAAGDRLRCDDGIIETHTFGGNPNSVSGVRISGFDADQKP
ncbi:MAG: hypothetical protein KKG59_01380, partial [Nanoarchaeota archaeon]|nr:hypothetical protein [Nanoarchaeota archaeon]